MPVKILRMIAAVTCGVFFLNTAGWSLPEAATEFSSPSSPKQIEVPESLASIQEIFQPDPKPHPTQNQPSIIFIQDIHTSVNVQEEIAQLIELYVERYGFKFVAYEGNSGPVQTEKVFWFPDQKLKRAVSETFLKKLQISGPEYAHANARVPFQLWGAENPAAYQKNLRVFQNALRIRQETLNLLQAIEKELIKAFEKAGSKEGLELFEGSRSFATHSPPRKRGSTFNGPRVKPGVSPSRKYKNSATAQLFRLEENYRKGRFDLLRYLQELIRILEERKIDYSHLKQIFRLAKQGTLNRKQTEEFFQELKQLEEMAERSIWVNPLEREIAQALERLGILKDIANLSATREELENYWKTPDRFQEIYFVQLIRRAHHPQKWTPPYRNFLDDLVEVASEFYRLAAERDGIIADQLMKSLEREQAAVLVAGGFHTPGITEVLRKKGVAHLVLSPKFDGTEKGAEKAYWDSILDAGPDGTGPSLSLISSTFRNPTKFNLPDRKLFQIEADRTALKIMERGGISFDPKIWQLILDDLKKLEGGVLPAGASLGESDSDGLSRLRETLLVPPAQNTDPREQFRIRNIHFNEMGRADGKVELGPKAPSDPEERGKFMEMFGLDADRNKKIWAVIHYFADSFPTSVEGLTFSVLENPPQALELAEENGEEWLKIDFDFFIAQPMGTAAFVEVLLGNYLRDEPNPAAVKLYAVIQALPYLLQMEVSDRGWIERRLERAGRKFLLGYLRNYWERPPAEQGEDKPFAVDLKDSGQKKAMLTILGEAWPKEDADFVELQTMSPQALQELIESLGRRLAAKGGKERLEIASKIIRKIKGLNRQGTLDDSIVQSLPPIRFRDSLRLLATRKEDFELLKTLIQLGGKPEESSVDVDAIRFLYEGLSEKIAARKLTHQELAGVLIYLNGRHLMLSDGDEQYPVSEFVRRDAAAVIPDVPREGIAEVKRIFLEALGGSLGRDLDQESSDWVLNTSLLLPPPESSRGPRELEIFRVVPQGESWQTEVNPDLDLPDVYMGEKGVGVVNHDLFEQRQRQRMEPYIEFVLPGLSRDYPRLLSDTTLVFFHNPPKSMALEENPEGGKLLKMSTGVLFPDILFLIGVHEVLFGNYLRDFPNKTAAKFYAVTKTLLYLAGLTGLPESEKELYRKALEHAGSNHLLPFLEGIWDGSIGVDMKDPKNPEFSEAVFREHVMRIMSDIWPVGDSGLEEFSREFGNNLKGTWGMLDRYAKEKGLTEQMEARSQQEKLGEETWGPERYTTDEVSKGVSGARGSLNEVSIESILAESRLLPPPLNANHPGRKEVEVFRIFPDRGSWQARVNPDLDFIELSEHGVGVVDQATIDRWLFSIRDMMIPGFTEAYPRIPDDTTLVFLKDPPKAMVLEKDPSGRKVLKIDILALSPITLFGSGFYEVLYGNYLLEDLPEEDRPALKLFAVLKALSKLVNMKEEDRSPFLENLERRGRTALSSFLRDYWSGSLNLNLENPNLETDVVLRDNIFKILREIWPEGDQEIKRLEALPARRLNLLWTSINHYLIAKSEVEKIEDRYEKGLLDKKYFDDKLLRQFMPYILILLVKDKKFDLLAAAARFLRVHLAAAELYIGLEEEPLYFQLSPTAIAEAILSLERNVLGVTRGPSSMDVVVEKIAKDGISGHPSIPSAQRQEVARIFKSMKVTAASSLGLESLLLRDLFDPQPEDDIWQEGEMPPSTEIFRVTLENGAWVADPNPDLDLFEFHLSDQGVSMVDKHNLNLNEWLELIKDVFFPWLTAQYPSVLGGMTALTIVEKPPQTWSFESENAEGGVLKLNARTLFPPQLFMAVIAEAFYSRYLADLPEENAVHLEQIVRFYSLIQGLSFLVTTQAKDWGQLVHTLMKKDNRSRLVDFLENVRKPKLESKLERAWLFFRNAWRKWRGLSELPADSLNINLDNPDLKNPNIRESMLKILKQLWAPDRKEINYLENMPAEELHARWHSVQLYHTAKGFMEKLERGYQKGRIDERVLEEIPKNFMQAVFLLLAKRKKFDLLGALVKDRDKEDVAKELLAGLKKEALYLALSAEELSAVFAHWMAQDEWVKADQLAEGEAAESFESILERFARTGHPDYPSSVPREALEDVARGARQIREEQKRTASSLGEKQEILSGHMKNTFLLTPVSEPKPAEKRRIDPQIPPNPETPRHLIDEFLNVWRPIFVYFSDPFPGSVEGVTFSIIDNPSQAMVLVEEEGGRRVIQIDSDLLSIPPLLAAGLEEILYGFYLRDLPNQTAVKFYALREALSRLLKNAANRDLFRSWLDQHDRTRKDWIERLDVFLRYASEHSSDEESFTLDTKDKAQRNTILDIMSEFWPKDDPEFQALQTMPDDQLERFMNGIDRSLWAKGRQEREGIAQRKIREIQDAKSRGELDAQVLRGVSLKRRGDLLRGLAREKKFDLLFDVIQLRSDPDPVWRSVVDLYEGGSSKKDSALSLSPEEVADALVDLSRRNIELGDGGEKVTIAEFVHIVKSDPGIIGEVSREFLEEVARIFDQKKAGPAASASLGRESESMKKLLDQSLLIPGRYDPARANAEDQELFYLDRNDESGFADEFPDDMRREFKAKIISLRAAARHITREFPGMAEGIRFSFVMNPRESMVLIEDERGKTLKVNYLLVEMPALFAAGLTEILYADYSRNHPDPFIVKVWAVMAALRILGKAITPGEKNWLRDDSRPREEQRKSVVDFVERFRESPAQEPPSFQLDLIQEPHRMALFNVLDEIVPRGTAGEEFRKKMVVLKGAKSASLGNEPVRVPESYSSMLAKIGEPPVTETDRRNSVSLWPVARSLFEEANHPEQWKFETAEERELARQYSEMPTGELEKTFETLRKTPFGSKLSELDWQSFQIHLLSNLIYGAKELEKVLGAQYKATEGYRKVRQQLIILREWIYRHWAGDGTARPLSHTLFPPPSSTAQGPAASSLGRSEPRHTDRHQELLIQVSSPREITTALLGHSLGVLGKTGKTKGMTFVVKNRRDVRELRALAKSLGIYQIKFVVNGLLTTRDFEALRRHVEGEITRLSVKNSNPARAPDIAIIAGAEVLRRAALPDVVSLARDQAARGRGESGGFLAIGNVPREEREGIDAALVETAWDLLAGGLAAGSLDRIQRDPRTGILYPRLDLLKQFVQRWVLEHQFDIAA